MFKAGIGLICLVSFMFNLHTGPTIQKDFVWQIDFQDHFKNDTTSLEINGQRIFSDSILSSESSDGLTKAIVKIYPGEKNKMRVNVFGNTTVIPYSDTLCLLVTINSISRFYKADLSKGKYVGLTKINNNNLLLSQSPRPFQYD
jgi:hypothetical protein